MNYINGCCLDTTYPDIQVTLLKVSSDVSLWYVLRGNSIYPVDYYDKDEFNGVRWFGLDEPPYERTDPHMLRFIEKLKRELVNHTVLVRSSKDSKEMSRE